MKNFGLIAVLFTSMAYAQTGAMGTSATGIPAANGTVSTPTGAQPGSNTSGSTLDTTPTIGGGARQKQKMEKTEAKRVNERVRSMKTNSKPVQD